MRGSIMTSNRLTLGRVLGLAVLLLVGACSKIAEPTVIVADRQRALRIVAEASGAFKDAPYQVQWSDFSTMPPLFEALDTGAVDLAASIDNLGLQAAIRGVNMRIVAVSHSSAAGDALIVSADSSIRTVADLKGHHVIVSTIKGGTADAVLIGALKEAGLSAKDVQIGYMAHGDALAAFTSGKIEAWATNDPAYAQAEEKGARLLRNGVGLRAATTYISANADSLQQPGKQKLIADFLRRFAKARAWGNAHRAEYAHAYATTTGLPEKLALRVLTRQDVQRFGPVDPAAIKEAQALADDYASRGLFPRGVVVRPFFDQSAFASTD